MGMENRVEDTGEEGNCSLQCPVRDTVGVQSLADLETPDGFMNLVWGG